MSRRWLYRLVAIAIGLAASFAIAELTFRVLETRADAVARPVGPEIGWSADPRWGWRATPGWFRYSTPEFTAEGTVNEHFMNDVPVDFAADASRVRVFATGDSHTFAYGVSQHETWPKQLEARLNAKAAAYRVYNASAIGYNLHQYVLRVSDQGPLFRPHVVIVGVTFASDFFDLLPPDRGGWIHGQDLERDYFDLDERGVLVKRHWAPASASAPAPAVQSKPLISRRIRSAVLHSATVRYFQRTPFALMVASHLRFGNTSLWPNMDIAMEREVAPEHEYNHRLFRALLARLKAETDRLQARLVIVGIPYLPQVYDDLRRWTFGGQRFDPGASSRRMREYCSALGITYIDTLDPFRDAVQASAGRWLHFPVDGHPTAGGHGIIADTVARAGILDALDLSTSPGKDGRLLQRPFR